MVVATAPLHTAPLELAELLEHPASRVATIRFLCILQKTLSGVDSTDEEGMALAFEAYRLYRTINDDERRASWERY
jgi:hypothetical protein